MLTYLKEYGLTVATTIEEVVSYIKGPIRFYEKVWINGKEYDSYSDAGYESYTQIVLIEKEPVYSYKLYTYKQSNQNWR